MNTRKGLGKGLGTGYKNIAPMDSHIHSLSAKGVKQAIYVSNIKNSKNLLKALDKKGVAGMYRHLQPEGTVITVAESKSSKKFREGKKILNKWVRSGKVTKIDNAQEYLMAKGKKSNKAPLQKLGDEEIKMMLDHPQTFGINAEEPEGRKKYKELEKVAKKRGLDAKGHKDLMKKMFQFEHLNSDYPNTQMEGIVAEISRPEDKYGFSDTGYIHEKVENIKRHYNGALDNFEQRILASKQLRQEFLTQVKKKK